MKKNRVEHTRVLVTGGAGFIGSNLVEDLLAHDNDVVVLDNFSTGKRENIRAFLENRHFHLLEGDIRDLAVCRRAMDGVEYVMHEAALGSVSRSIENPMASTEVNVVGFVNVLFAAKEAGVRRVVYASSSSVYGSSMEIPKVEERIGRPLAPYAITKYVDELFAANFHELYGSSVVGLRYFNVFGRRQDPYGAYAAVIPVFIRQLLRHEQPVINGDGKTSRDFTYVANVVKANHLALLADEASSNTVYNIACGDTTSLNDLYRILVEVLSEFDPAIASVQPIYGPFRKGDVAHSLACIDKARANLGYEPDYSFERGIRDAGAWYFDYLSGQ